MTLDDLIQKAMETKLRYPNAGNMKVSFVTTTDSGEELINPVTSTGLKLGMLSGVNFVVGGDTNVGR